MHSGLPESDTGVPAGVNGLKTVGCLSKRRSWSGERKKKADSTKSASYESIVLCSNSKKEVRQYGAQRPSLDVAFTCKGDIALNG